MRVFKAIGVLLIYPSQKLVDSLPAIRSTVQDTDGEKLPSPIKDRLLALVDSIGRERLLDLQERYVALFDQTRSLSLFLFEHNFGDASERGQAMVELRQLYATEGFDPTKTELPDYVPMLCEFLSIAPPSVGAALLADTAPILTALHATLAERESPYAAAFEALLALADVEVNLGSTADVASTSRFAARSGPAKGIEPPPMDEIDRDWEEPPVTFGMPPQTPPLVAAETLLRQTPQRLKEEGR